MELSNDVSGFEITKMGVVRLGFIGFFSFETKPKILLEYELGH